MYHSVPESPIETNFTLGFLAETYKVLGVPGSEELSAPECPFETNSIF